MKLIKVKILKHIEGFSEKRVRLLKEKIVSEQLWTRPICIEKNHNLVLDGQHRLEVAKQLGFRDIPCILFNYEEVDVWSLRPNHEVNYELVIQKSLAGDIYPYKTAKHRFPVDIVDCNVPLDALGQR